MPNQGGLGVPAGRGAGTPFSITTRDSEVWDLRPHIHTGVFAFLFAAGSAILAINGLRLISAKMVDSDRFAGAGKVIGSLVEFS